MKTLDGMVTLGSKGNIYLGNLIRSINTCSEDVGTSISSVATTTSNEKMGTFRFSSSFMIPDIL